MTLDCCLTGTRTCKKRWTRTAPQIGLKLNTAKTKLMRINNKTDNPITINNINNSDALEDVQDFAYPGSKITTDGDSAKDATARIRKASQTFAMLKPIWKSKQLRLETKPRLYNSNVLSVLKRRRGRPKETWRRTVEKEIKECGLTWNTITKWAADRQQWRSLVDALCATGHEED